MGQSSHKQSLLNYKKKDFIREQIQYYRWRSDTLCNQHISRVFFHFQQMSNDSQKFNNLIESKFYANQHITINQLLSITQNNPPTTNEELMTFENYISHLSEFQEKLSLEEILYVLQVMLNGYDMIFNKLGKCKVELSCCFVTLEEGEVRIWLNENYKSNEIEEIITFPPTNALLMTEISIIKKILQSTERLANNSTELLHFTRQFKQFMERNILQHWNFTNARKFINNYAYTYKINMPINLIAAINRKFKYSLYALEKESSPSSQPSFIQTQSQRQIPNEQKSSKASLLNSLLRQEHMRPMCHSDYSHKKASTKQNSPFCQHSKKFTSTDVKYMSERKGSQSQKMNRSQVIYKKNEEITHKENTSFRLEHHHGPLNASNVSNIKYRKERELAIMGDSTDFKIGNFSTNVGLSPNSNSTPKEFEKGQAIDSSNKIFNKGIPFTNFTNNYVKTETFPKEKQKEKKKLEKKVALNKYISYYKKESDISIDVPTARQPHGATRQQQPYYNTQPSDLHHQTHQSHSKLQISHDSVKMTSPFQYNNQKELPIRQEYISHFKYNSMDHQNVAVIIDQLQKGKSQQFLHKDKPELRTFQPSLMNTYSKTVNKLVGNHEVSEHESKGSFMSIEQCNRSDYNGVLMKMGRSVDFLNINFSKKTIHTKKSIGGNGNHMKKSINC